MAWTRRDENVAIGSIHSRLHVGGHILQSTGQQWPRTSADSERSLVRYFTLKSRAAERATFLRLLRTTSYCRATRQTY
jgi:hypothetical protein